MHNHYHVILHINSYDAETWTTEEVINRWHRLYKGTVLTQRFSDGMAMSKAELAVVDTIITQWRSRLMNISWFMRILNKALHVKPIKKISSVRNQLGYPKFSIYLLTHVYLALGVNMEDHKELLDMWISENEEAKFWLSVLTELQHRGVRVPVLMALKAFLMRYKRSIHVLRFNCVLFT